VIVKKSPAEIDAMARAGALLAATMDMIESNIRPGVTTAELDAAASICASPNAMVVHGIPGPYELSPGDILSVDVGVTLDGWVADAARTFPVGPISPVAQNLLAVTRASLHAGVQQCRPGNRLGDLSNAIQRVAEAGGLSVIRSLVGHGVGRNMHEDPQVPNYGRPGRGPKLEPGMVLAVEPMLTAGRPAVRVATDGWAIFTQDSSLAAHFEFTVAITPEGPRVLTPWHIPPEHRDLLPCGVPLEREAVSARQSQSTTR